MRLLNHKLLAILDIDSLARNVLGRGRNLATHQVIDCIILDKIRLVFYLDNTCRNLLVIK